MTAIPFYTPVADFRTGDVLSSTKMNQVLTNLDAIYGLDQRMSIGCTYGLTTASATNGPSDWRGWVAYHGKQLVINLRGAALLEFDGPAPFTKQHYFTVRYGSGGVKTIQMPSDVGYQDYEVYRIRVSDTVLAPYYAYMTDTNAAAIGALPAFTNGTASSAGNFNAILTASNILAEQFNQPIVSTSVWSNEGWLNGNGEYSIDFWMQHRHPQFEFYLTASSSGAAGGTPLDVLRWSVNDETFWSHTIPRPGSYNPGTPVVVDHPLLSGLTVGNWYHYRFEHETSEGSHDNGMSKLYWYGERQIANDSSLFAHYVWVRMHRWDAGNVVNGSSGEDPVLIDMNLNLGFLDGRRYSTNQVMRQSTQDRDDPDNGSRTERTFSRRVHRWLAYENANENDTPTLFYTTTQPNVLASVNLTASYNRTVYLDLDTTPVKNGMVFYVDNCNYAIQVPEPPGRNS